MMSESTRAELERLGNYRRNLPTVIRDTIFDARADGATWPQIGLALGVSAEAARKLGDPR